MPDGAVAGDKQKQVRSWDEAVSDVWTDIRLLYRGFMIAGASTVSVLIGFLLFFGAPQAQDLFLEVKADVFTALTFWALFYLSVMLMWALPVYVSSRWILARFDGSHGANGRGELIPVWVRRTIPPILLVLCFAAVLVGQLSALWNAPMLVDENANFRISLAYEAEPCWNMGSTPRPCSRVFSAVRL